MDIIFRASNFLKNTAVSCRGRSFTYADLLLHSSSIKDKLLQGRKSLEGERVAFLSPQSYEFVPAQWGIWQAGGISVPLCLQYPPPEWEYVINDTQASAVICHSRFLSQLGPLAEKNNFRLIPYSDFSPASTGKIEEFSVVDPNQGAQIIYTSGTTGKPKGAVTTHKAIKAQIESLVSAWKWTPSDHILEVLPLHHVHGNINIVSCALYSGAKVTFHEKFEAQKVWNEFLSSDLSLFMAVPTVYSKLIAQWKEMNSGEKAAATEACKKFRLMVSGSMALPEFTLDQWREISNHMLLERYGMTECGMILSNPLEGVRRPGFVGKPLPGVHVKIEKTELLVKSDAMFKEYFNKPEATKAAFDEDGWFITGDIVSESPEGDFQILGRASVDIIKSAGYKLSALEIENALLSHPEILEVAIVGVPDDVYGQVIGAIIKPKEEITLETLQNWCKERIASNKIPKMIYRVKEIPRNQMGKINKKELVKLFNK